MGKFAYIDKAGVSLFQRSLNTIRATKRAEKEPPMPLSTSATDVAWAAVYRLAQEMVRAREAADVRAAVDLLREVDHPVYARYLAASDSERPPASTTGADVVKRAEEAALAKRRTVFAEVNKRVDRLVQTGLAPEAAMREVFAKDRALYNQHREASYASGPLPPVTHTAMEVPRGPVQAEVSRLAKALKADDPWGRYRAASEPELVEEVFKRHPALYWAHRAEVLR